MGEGFGRDVRNALRVFARAPGYAAVVVLTLGLGIGANSAIFSAINGVLLQPLPYEHGERLLRVYAGPLNGAGQPTGLSPLELQDFRERSTVLTDLVEYHTMFFNLLEEEVEPERVQVGVVSWDFFQVVGVTPLHGRLFTPEEDHVDAEPVLVLGHGYWLRRYGGDPEVVGRTVEMNNRPHRIVGVLPPVPTYPNQNDVWMPWYACPFRVGDGWNLNRAARSLVTVGRMAPGTGEATARQEVARVAHALHRDFPDAYPPGAEVDGHVVPLATELTQEARPTFLVLMGMALLVLVIACANVANLTLARMNRRRHEIAVRTALGAGRMRLARGFLAESLVLSVAGAVVAALVAWGTVGGLAAFAADLTPRFAEVEVDLWVLAFTAVVAVATGLLVAAGPVLVMDRVGTALREGKGSSGVRAARARAGLVSLQVAFATVLLVGSGLMLRSFAGLVSVDPGFESEGVLTVTLDLDWARYTTSESRRDFLQQLLERVRERPGVAKAALASDFPMSGSTFQSQAGLDVEGAARGPGVPAPQVGLRAVSDGYVEALGIPLLQGRTFTPDDRAETEAVAVVSASLARRHLGANGAVGRRLSLDGGQSWVQVVGVVGDVRQAGFEADPGIEVYRPFSQLPQARRLLVRTQGDPMAFARPVTEDVLALDARQPVSFVQTLSQAQADRVSSPRTVATLLGIFALIALVMAGAGLFSLISYSVSQQRREIGIRLALGAERRTVVRSILLRGLALVVAGLILGAVAALASGRVLQGFLFGVSAADPATYLLVTTLLLGVAASAILGPALRGSAVSPTVALREE